MVIDLKVNEIANLGSNVKTMIKNENCSVLMMSDATGEGIMTVYRVIPGVFSIMQENELRLDNRENHKGTTYYPLRHYHGVSVFMDVEETQKALDAVMISSWHYRMVMILWSEKAVEACLVARNSVSP